MEQEHPQTPGDNFPKWQGEIQELQAIQRELPWLTDERLEEEGAIEKEEGDRIVLREIYLDSKDPRSIIELAKNLRQECNGIGFAFLDESGESIGYAYDDRPAPPEYDPEFQGEGPIRFIQIDYLTFDEDHSATTTRIIYRIHYKSEGGQI